MHLHASVLTYNNLHDPCSIHNLTHANILDSIYTVNKQKAPFLT